MSEQLGQILSALESIREKQSEQRESIAALRTEIHAIIGNGQPGRLGIVEQEIKDLREWQAHSKGWFAGLGAVAAAVGALGHWFVDSIRHK